MAGKADGQQPKKYQAAVLPITQMIELKSLRAENKKLKALVDQFEMSRQRRLLRDIEADLSDLEALAVNGWQEEGGGGNSGKPSSGAKGDQVAAGYLRQLEDTLANIHKSIIKFLDRRESQIRGRL